MKSQQSQRSQHSSLTQSHRENRNASNVDNDDRYDGYKPSPYPISILPTVPLSKPKPAVVKSDIPPTPLLLRDDKNSNNDDNESGDNDDDGNNVKKENSNNGSSENGNDNDTSGSGANGQSGLDTSSETVQLPRSTNSPNSSSKSNIVGKLDKLSPMIQVIAENDSAEPNSHRAQNAQHNQHETQKELTNNSESTKCTVCSICQRHVARYTCPKCNMPYCSVSCYQHHGQSDTATDISGGLSGGVCTESFYKNRVLSTYSSLNDDNDKYKLRGILSRIHGDVNEELDKLERREGYVSQMLHGGNGDEQVDLMGGHGIDGNLSGGARSNLLDFQSGKDANGAISDEDLAELAAYVLHMDGDGDDDGDHHDTNDESEEERGKRILDQIPPRLLHAFECALAHATNITNAANATNATNDTRTTHDANDGSNTDVSNNAGASGGKITPTSSVMSAKDGKGAQHEKQRRLEEAWKPFLGKDMTIDQIDQLSTLSGDKDNANDVNMPMKDGINSNMMMVGSSNNDHCKVWTPWWLPGGQDFNDHGEGLSAKPTLDERIVALPPLPKLRTANQNSHNNQSSNQNNTTLAFNIIEVLYASSFVLRRHFKVMDKTDTAEIADCLLSQSRVLSMDARYGSVREALVASSEQLVHVLKTAPSYTVRGREFSGTGGSSGGNKGTEGNGDGETYSAITWKTLASDVAILSRHRRYVLRLLFETLDILQSGVDFTRKELKSIKSKHRDSRESDVDSKRKLGITQQQLEQCKLQYKLAHKKVSYFLSWCAGMWTTDMGEELSDQIRYFMDEMQALEEEIEEESPVETLLRSIHSTSANEIQEGTTGDAFGIDLGLGRKPFQGMENQLVSVSTVRKNKTLS